MHSPDERLSPEDAAYGIERAKQLVAASRDPKSRLMLAHQIFDDTFTREVPKRGAVIGRNGQGQPGHAVRDTVPELPPPPQVYPNDDAATQLEQSEYYQAITARMGVVADNERKLRALLWARATFLDAGDEGGFAETIESHIRERFVCSLPELPRDTAGIEQCVRANARASWATLNRIARERAREAAE